MEGTTTSVAPAANPVANEPRSQNPSSPSAEIIALSVDDGLSATHRWVEEAGPSAHIPFIPAAKPEASEVAARYVFSPTVPVADLVTEVLRPPNFPAPHEAVIHNEVKRPSLEPSARSWAQVAAQARPSQNILPKVTRDAFANLQLHPSRYPALTRGTPKPVGKSNPFAVLEDTDETEGTTNSDPALSVTIAEERIANVEVSATHSPSPAPVLKEAHTDSLQQSLPPAAYIDRQRPIQYRSHRKGGRTLHYHH
jgi:hypothetical protein